MGDPAGDGGLLDDLPVFDAEGWLEELELGSDPGAASLGDLVQVDHRCPPNQLERVMEQLIKLLLARDHLGDLCAHYVFVVK